MYYQTKKISSTDLKPEEHFKLQKELSNLAKNETYNYQKAEKIIRAFLTHEMSIRSCLNFYYKLVDIYQKKCIKCNSYFLRLNAKTYEIYCEKHS